MDPEHSFSNMPVPPEASPSARKLAARLAAPVEKFLHRQTSSGFILLGMAAIALVWANSPWKQSYVDLWHTPIGIGIGDWSMVKSLHFWINDLLMTFFFLVAGFEIKREMAEGELSDMQRAALPIAAAIGGMLIPAAIYFAFNTSGPSADGWGVPMATDIAFALGILVLLGPRVPAALRILLLALAIIDDIGAILVIAVFYSSGFAIEGLYVVMAGLLILLLFRRLGIRPGVVYFVPLMVIWGGLYKMGVHPTIAGVIVGMAAPVKPWLGREQFYAVAQKSIAQFQKASQAHDHDPEHAHHDEELLEPLNRLSLAGREVVAPVVRLQNEFHPWVAFIIMPLFALANAGVNVSGLDFSSPEAMPVMLGVSLGLVVGKPLGVLLVSWLLIKLGWAKLPRGVTWGGMLILGFCAGIGFTMAIFIDELAFAGMPFLAIGKLAILIATAVAAIAALVLGRVLLPRELAPDVAAMSPADVEASTEY